MDIATTAEALRELRDGLEGTVGFVPTMGYLHDGHLSLMRAVDRVADHLVVSIFVNPTQFGPGEDLDDYPRDPQGDRQKCEAMGCELLFTPTTAAMYADDHATTVHVAGLDQALCGPRRPGHFDGVTTIVSKLFHIVGPDYAAFGEKDYQQLAIIRRMVRDLNFPVEILAVPTVREADGLAMSSRNRYLGAAERQRARCLSQALAAAWHAYNDRGVRDGQALVEVATDRLLEDVAPEAIDYVECVHPDALTPYAGARRAIDAEAGAVVALAVQVGPARLIDNLSLDRPLPEALT